MIKIEVTSCHECPFSDVRYPTRYVGCTVLGKAVQGLKGRGIPAKCPLRSVKVLVKLKE